MPLTDPELDLLREMLAEDPGDEAFLQVGEELVRRSRWSEAVDVLTGGLAAVPAARERPRAGSGEGLGWSLLARAGLESGAYEVSLAALRRVSTDPREAPEHARIEFLALERAGRVDEARAKVDAYLAFDANDVVATSARERLEAPAPEPGLHATDPFLTVRRAEQFVANGRVDRAIRIYRRIAFRHPKDAGLRMRLLQLAANDSRWATDDLSDELADPAASPPVLVMPSPTLSVTQAPAPTAREHGPGGEGDDELTEPGVVADALRELGGSGFDDDSDEADTDVRSVDGEGSAERGAGKGGRRRRRSLIHR